MTHADAASYALSLLLKASAVLAVTWLFAVLLRRRSAGIRHALWSLAFGAVLALPLISSWVPPLEVDLSSATTVYERLVTGSDLESARMVELPPAASAAGREVATSSVPYAAGEPSVAPAFERFGRPAAYVLAAWLVGAVTLFLIFCVDLARIRRATRYAVSKERISDMSARLAEELTLRRSPRAYVGDVDLPVTWGLFRPVVLLPVGAAEWSRRRLRMVLMHELAHVHRVDYLPHVLAELSCILYWPNPLVWIARRRLREEQEQACDDFVLRSGTASHDYAELLLELARSLGRRTMLPGGVRMAERKGLKARIRAILDPDLERRTVSRLTFAVVALAVGLTALSAAALRSAADVRESEAVGPVDQRAAPSAGDEGEQESDPGEDAIGGHRVFTRILEAESGLLTAPMSLHRDDDASGGRFVMVPDQDGHDAPEGGAGRATFRVDLTAPGSRAIWARVIGDDGKDNSFFVSVDGGDEFRWDIRGPRGSYVERWTWLPVMDRSGKPLGLGPGDHTLTFRNREDGSRLDAVFLTSDPALVPRGRSPLPPPERSVSMAFEAEQPAEIVAPMEIRADDRASGRLYVSVADGFDSRSRPPGDGRVSYRVDAPAAGFFVIWARVVAPDDDDDSFWIRANGGEWIRWNGIEENDNWTWQLVHDSGDDDEIALFPLRAGSNSIDVSYREDGAMIDRFVVTNNAYAHPSDLDHRGSGVSVTFKD